MNQEKDDVNNNKDTLTLVIEYGNGEQERYANIPYEPSQFEEKVGVTDVLNRAHTMYPEMDYGFEASGYNRWGSQYGEIVSVKGIDAESPVQKWQVSVNQVPVTGLLTRAGRRGTGLPVVEPGDVITLTLVTARQEDG